VRRQSPVLRAADRSAAATRAVHTEATADQAVSVLPGSAQISSGEMTGRMDRPAAVAPVAARMWLLLSAAVTASRRAAQDHPTGTRRDAANSARPFQPVELAAIVARLGPLIVNTALDLCVPKTSSMSCDLRVFVDHAAKAITPTDFELI
jgi:hypothetical protein